MAKRITALLLVLGLLLGMTACAGRENKKTKEDPVALSTEHFSFTEGELAYMYAMMYSQYGYYAMYYGWDLLAETVNYAEVCLYYNEAALAEGITLSEEDEKTLTDLKATIESRAADATKSAEDYVAEQFGTEKITPENIEGAQRKLLMYTKYYDTKEAELALSDADIEEEYKKNQKNYDVVDYIFVNFYSEELSADVIETIRAAFKAAASYEEFVEAAKTYYSAAADPAKIEKEGGLDAYTESALQTNTVTAEGYFDDPFGNWSFEPERKAGEVFVQEDTENKQYLAMYLTKTPYKEYTIDVRHILFKVGTEENSYATAELAREKADEIYAAWVADGAKEEQFIELCKEYSADGNASTGGLYTGVTPGQMVQSFNDWCFDESRSIGDYGIVDTTYGSHMMFFAGKNYTWPETVKTALTHAYFEDLEKSFEEKYPITKAEDVIADVTKPADTASSEAKS